MPGRPGRHEGMSMYSAKILGTDANASLSINHSKHKAAMNDAIKNKKQLPHGNKKK